MNIQAESGNGLMVETVRLGRLTANCLAALLITCAPVVLQVNFSSGFVYSVGV